MDTATTDPLEEPPPYAPAAGDATHPQSPGEEARAAALSVADQYPDLPGYTLDGTYRVGGMGLVFRGRSLRLESPVAVKMIRPERVVSPLDIWRFENEAKAAAGVQHLHVAKVYDRGEHLGRPFYIMEYLAGGSLADRLHRDGPLAPPDAARLVYKLAKAVHACHETGVIHRDIKPANVLLDDDGQPKLIDFGVSLRQTQTTDQPAYDPTDEPVRRLVGTPKYMAPEQYRSADGVSRPADVYSLGVLLYECLTGQVPFPEADPDAYYAKQMAGPMPPLGPGHSSRLGRVCRACLAVDPAARYRTAKELADDLSRFAAGQGVVGAGMLAGPVPQPPRFGMGPSKAPPAPRSPDPSYDSTVPRPAWRSPTPDLPRSGRPWVVVAVAVVAAGLAVGEGCRGSAARRRLAMTEYGRRIDRATANPTAAREVLDDCPADARGWEWRYADRLSRGVAAAPGPMEIATATSPDGRRTVTAHPDGVRLWCTATGVELLLLPVGGVTAVGFTADGTAVVAAGADGTPVRVWDAGPATSD